MWLSRKKSVPKWSTRDEKCLGCGYLECFTRSLYSWRSNYSTHRNRSIRVKLIRSNRCWRSSTVLPRSSARRWALNSPALTTRMHSSSNLRDNTVCLASITTADGIYHVSPFLRRWFRTALAGSNRRRLSATSICCACC